MTEAADSIRIFLRDCRVALRVGIHDQEKLNPQPVSVSVEMQAVLSQRFDDAAERSLDRVINYERLYHFLTHDLAAFGHIYLLETAAERVADFCLSWQQVERVTVRLEKTTIFPATAGAGIEITRNRGRA